MEHIVTMKKKQAKPGSGLKWLHEHKDYSSEFCLLWPFGRAEGYGTLGAPGGGMQYAHRVMCELVYGPAPSPKHHAAHTASHGQTSATSRIRLGAAAMLASACVNARELNSSSRKYRDA